MCWKLTTLQGLGFAWNPEMKPSFSRTICYQLIVIIFNPLFILGEDISFPHLLALLWLVVWLSLHLRFTTSHVKSLSGIRRQVWPHVDSNAYVRWDPESDDFNTLKLHHESLMIPPRVVINCAVINELDEMFKVPMKPFFIPENWSLCCTDS